MADENIDAMRDVIEQACCIIRCYQMSEADGEFSDQDEEVCEWFKRADAAIAAQPPPQGNASDLRGAIAIIRDMLINGGHDAQCRAKIVAICDTVLSMPPRNCDVGTVDEQHGRFVSYCDGCDCPMGCDHRKNFVGVLRPECSSILKCFARWAQMPYKEEVEPDD